MSQTKLGRGAATAELWLHLDRRIPAVAAAVAVSGLPVQLIEDAARVSFALSCEFEALLEGMQERIRQLPSVLEDHPERCVHSVRGPVLWSETITARANSLGDDDVFVCRSVRRSFDCAENRLLIWLLERGSSAGRLLRRRSGTPGVAGRMDPGALRRTEEIGAKARAWRNTPRLAGIVAHSANHADVTRIRRKRAVGPDTSALLAARRRARQPFTAEELASLCDEPTSGMHERVLEAFRAAGGADFTLACSRNTLSCCGVGWRHPAFGSTGLVQASS